MKEKWKSSSYVTIMMTILIILSPLEHAVGVEKILYTFGLLVAAVSILRRRIIVMDETCSLLLFVCYAFLTCYWSENPTSFTSLFNTAVMYAFLFLVLQHSYSVQDYERFKKAFIIQGAVLLLLCFKFGTYQDNRFWIISSTTGADPNYLSGWFILPVTMATEYLLKKNNIFIKLILIAEIGLSFYFVAQSGSRSGLICVAFSVFVYTIWMLRFQIRTKPLYGIIGIVVFIVLISIAIQKIPAYTLYRFTKASDAGNMGGRTIIWKNLLSTLLNRPIQLICGMGQGAAVLYSGAGVVAHNTYLDIFFENGLIGLLLYLYYFFTAIKGAFKKDSAIGISFVAIGILIFTLSSTYMRFLIFMLFVAGCHTYEKDQQ